jgi:hypothetical protein
MPERCSNCVHWAPPTLRRRLEEPRKLVEWGPRCQRPRPADARAPIGATNPSWPVAHDQDWCFEHQERRP